MSAHKTMSRKRHAPEEFHEDPPLVAWARSTDPDTSKAADEARAALGAKP